MTEIISRAEWEELLGRSRALLDRLKRMEREGEDPDAIAVVARNLRSVNRKIRDPRLLKVRGIDA
jgi:hypothetical protein